MKAKEGVAARKEGPRTFTPCKRAPGHGRTHMCVCRGRRPSPNALSARLFWRGKKKQKQNTATNGNIWNGNENSIGNGKGEKQVISHTPKKVASLCWFVSRVRKTPRSQELRANAILSSSIGKLPTSINFSNPLITYLFKAVLHSFVI